MFRIRPSTRSRRAASSQMNKRTKHIRNETDFASDFSLSSISSDEITTSSDDDKDNDQYVNSKNVSDKKRRFEESALQICLSKKRKITSINHYNKQMETTSDIIDNTTKRYETLTEKHKNNNNTKTHFNGYKNNNKQHNKIIQTKLGLTYDEKQELKQKFIDKTIVIKADHNPKDITKKK
eukprot:409336_1